MKASWLAQPASFMLVLLLTACNEEENKTYSRVSVGNQSGAAQSTPTDSKSLPSAAPAQDSASAQAPPHAGSGGGFMSGMGMPSPPSIKIRQGGNVLEAAGVAFTLPDTWKQEKPSSSFRVAQYSIPGSAGPAEMALFYFGPGQGGTAEQNVQRWVGQFTSDDPTTTAVPMDVGMLERDGIHVSLVKCSGTYHQSSMMPLAKSGPAEQKNWALFGMVVDSGKEGNLYIKITGPKQTMDEQQKNLEAFAQNAHASKFK